MVKYVMISVFHGCMIRKEHVTTELGEC